MITIQNRYAPRPVRSLGTWELSGATFKVYGIAANRDEPRPALVEAARVAAGNVACVRLAEWNHHGVGFVGVHDGATGNFVFVDVWTDDNELRHVLFVSPSDSPANLREVRDDVIACVWDLAVVGFERRAWIEHVLANPRGPDRNAYLAERLEGMAQ